MVNWNWKYRDRVSDMGDESLTLSLSWYVAMRGSVTPHKGQPDTWRLRVYLGVDPVTAKERYRGTSAFSGVGYAISDVERSSGKL